MKPESVRGIFGRALVALALFFALLPTANSQTAVAPSGNDSESAFGPRTLRPVFPARLVFWTEEESDSPPRPSRVLPLARRNPLPNLLLSPISAIRLESLPGFGIGAVSANGSFPDTNEYSAVGASYRLGVAADDSTLVRDAGRLPAVTASGGMNSLAPVSTTNSVSLNVGDLRQTAPGLSFNGSNRWESRGFRGRFFEYFGNDLLTARDPFAGDLGLGKGSLRANMFGGSIGSPVGSDDFFFLVGYEGLRLRQPAFSVAEVPDNAVRTSAVAQTSAWLRAFPSFNRGAATAGFGVFAATFANPADHDIFDASFGAKPGPILLFYRYRIADSSAAVRGDRGFSASTVRESEARTESHSVTASRGGGSYPRISGGFGYSRNKISQAFSIDGFGGGNAPVAAVGFFRFDAGGFGSSIASSPRVEADLRRIQSFGQVSFSVYDTNIEIGADFRRFAFEPGLAASESRFEFASANAAGGGVASRIATFQRLPIRSSETSSGGISAFASSILFNRVSLKYGAIWHLDRPASRAADGFDYPGASVQMPDSTGNFAPRIAASWSFGNNSISGGAGLYYDLNGSRAAEAEAMSFPITSGAFVLNSPVGTSPANAIRPFALFDRDLKTPRVWQIRGEYARLLPFRAGNISASYIETFGQNLYRTRTIIDTAAAYNLVRLTKSDGSSRFRAFRVNWGKTAGRSFGAGVSYSLSKSTDDAPRDSLFEVADASFFTRRAASDFDIRHSFIASFGWELPVIFDGGLLERITQDWNLAMISYARSAAPVNVGTIRLGGFGREFAAAKLVSTPRIEDGNQILSAAAFRPATVGVAGSSGRNRIRGFAFFQTDVSIRKRVRTSSNRGFEFSATLENVFNSSNRSDFSGILGTELPGGGFQPNSFFGRAVGIVGGNGFTAFNQLGGPRSLTLGLRFSF